MEEKLVLILSDYLELYSITGCNYQNWKMKPQNKRQIRARFCLDMNSRWGPLWVWGLAIVILGERMWVGTANGRALREGCLAGEMKGGLMLIWDNGRANYTMACCHCLCNQCKTPGKISRTHYRKLIKFNLIKRQVVRETNVRTIQITVKLKIILLSHNFLSDSLACRFVTQWKTFISSV